MSDWQVGDLALCVVGGHTTREGLVYRVAHVVGPREWLGELRNIEDALVLVFEELLPLRASCGADATRFRKIKPDKHESCEPEFVTLLKRNRVSA